MTSLLLGGHLPLSFIFLVHFKSLGIYTLVTSLILKEVSVEVRDCLGTDGGM